MRWALAFFFLSGITGLVYEVLWTRRLTLTFGHTVFAVSTVLTAYMSGLALGSVVGGRWADRRWTAEAGPGLFLRAYGLLEGFVGLWALASMPLLGGVEALYLRLAHQGWTGLQLQMVCFVGSLLVLLPPTAAMGATLPVMSRLLVLQETQVGRLLSRIYAINTLGAFVGASLAGFVLLPALGLKVSLVIAAAVNIGICVASHFVRLSDTATRDAAGEVVAAPAPFPRVLVPIAFCFTGAASMACQVGWTRGLILSLGSSVYAFSAILSAFLAGLGLGSLLYARVVRTARPRLEHLAWLQAAVGWTCALTIPALGVLPILLGEVFPYVQHSFTLVLGVDIGIAALLLLAPTFLMGLGFPLATHLYSQDLRFLGRDVGDVYSANTLGCILGAFAAGFLLIPHLGAQWTLKAAAAVNLATALMLLLVSRGARTRTSWAAGAACLVGLAGVYLLPRWDPTVMSSGVAVYATSSPERRAMFRTAPPTYYRDGVSTTVTVHVLADGTLALRVNGKTDASTGRYDMLHQRLLGYLPGLLHPAPRTALIVGLGSGVTADSVRSLPGMERVDCAELEPAVIEAAGLWKAHNADVLADPRVTVVPTDGRTFALGSPRQYDIIMNQPSNPWIAGIGNLFTVDFYLGCERRLAPDGVMLQWVQLYGMDWRDLGMVVKTFYEVFPHGTIWYTHLGDLLMVGTREPRAVDLERIRGLWKSCEPLHRHMWQIGVSSPEELMGHFLLTREEALAAFTDAGLNTDDRPLLEFSAPRSLYRKDQAAAVNFERLDGARRSLVPPGVTMDSAMRTGVLATWADVGRRDAARREVAALPAGYARSLLTARLAAFDKQPAAARKSFETALKQATAADRGLVAALWADMEMGEQQWARAAALYREALEAAPLGSEETLWRSLGNALMEARDTAAGERALREAVRVGGSARSWRRLAIALYSMGRLDEARQSFDRAVVLDPSDYRAHLGIANVLFRQEKTAEALAEYQRVLALRPDCEEALINVGACFAQTGAPKQAIAAYRRLLLYQPDNPIALRNLQVLEEQVR